MFLLDRLQCQWTTTDSLVGPREQERERERPYTLHSRVHLYGTNAIVRDCVRQRDWESGRTHLSTGNKLTSRRKLASILWEGLVGGAKGRQVRGLVVFIVVVVYLRGEKEPLPAGETRNASSRSVPKCESDWAKPAKTFCPGNLLFMARDSAVNAWSLEKERRSPRTTIGAEETDGEKEKEKERTGNCKRGENIEKRPLFK